MKLCKRTNKIMLQHSNLEVCGSRYSFCPTDYGRPILEVGRSFVSFYSSKPINRHISNTLTIFKNHFRNIFQRELRNTFGGWHR